MGEGISKETEAFLSETKEATSDLGAFRERLTMQVRRLNALDEEPEEELSVENTPAFKAAIKYFGEFPPLKLVHAVASYYEKKKMRILFTDIPEIMNEMGLKKAETVDGQVVTVAPEVSASVNKQRWGEAYEWLISEGYGDHIKDILTFPKGEFDDAIRELLQEVGASYEQKSEIHSSTLKSIMRKRVEAGESLPDEELISVKVADRARVK